MHPAELGRIALNKVCVLRFDILFLITLTLQSHSSTNHGDDGSPSLTDMPPNTPFNVTQAASIGTYEDDVVTVEQ